MNTTTEQPTLTATLRTRYFLSDEWHEIYSDKPMTDMDLYEEQQYLERQHGVEDWRQDGYSHNWQWSSNEFIYQLSWVPVAEQ